MIRLLNGLFNSFRLARNLRVVVEAQHVVLQQRGVPEFAVACLASVNLGFSGFFRFSNFFVVQVDEMILERQVRGEFQAAKTALKVSLECFPTIKTNLFASNFAIFRRSASHTFFTANRRRLIVIQILGNLKNEL